MPLPPVGVEPVRAAGAVPLQIVCAAVIVLLPGTGFTVTVAVVVAPTQDVGVGPVGVMV